MQRTSSPRGGFTLVELLVVVGILAVLISVLIPTIKTVRESSKRAVCGANLRQIYQGALAYANRYDGALPGVVYPWMHDTLSTENVPWAPAMLKEMFSYIDGRLYRCPSDYSVSTYGYNAEDDWRDRSATNYGPTDSLNQTSYLILMGVTHHPDSLLKRGESFSPAVMNRFPPRTSPNGFKRGCIYDDANLNNNTKHPVHIANLKDVVSPRAILMMDKYYSKLQTNLYGDYAAQTAVAGRLVSNHQSSQVVDYGSVKVVLSKGVNVLCADGSVKWMDTLNEDINSVVANPRFGGKMLYHRDYIWTIYADSEHHWRSWPK